MLVSKDPDRIETLISEKRVKLHIFEPSQRKVCKHIGMA